MLPVFPKINGARKVRLLSENILTKIKVKIVTKAYPATVANERLIKLSGLMSVFISETNIRHGTASVILNRVTN
jgi:hypothetical protein